MLKLKNKSQILVYLLQYPYDAISIIHILTALKEFWEVAEEKQEKIQQDITLRNKLISEHFSYFSPSLLPLHMYQAVF